MLTKLRTEFFSGRAPALTAFCMAALLAVNIYFCLRLFSTEFTGRMESIESAYMSISRWFLDHWGDTSWFPLWFTGSPFQRVYQPGLHVTVAALAKLVQWTPQHAYHFLTALTYCLSPLALFWLCWRATARRGYAFLCGMLYSLLSPLCFFASAVRGDAGGWLSLRRYQVLVHYGEGPHTTAVALLPIAIWLLDRAVFGRRVWFFPAAVAALAAVVLTNWPGSIGLSCAIAAYVIARACKDAWLWLTLASAALLAYLIACPWIPPSVIDTVLQNAQRSDGTVFGWSHVIPPVLLLAGLATADIFLRRAESEWWLRFCVHFTLITGTVVVGRHWFGWRLLPQSNRFELEFDMAFCCLAAWCALAAARRMPRWLQVSAACVLAGLFAGQVRLDRQYARRMTDRIDITSTIEYRMAKWFDANMRGQRVFAPGNVSYWMNMFSDVPQVAGCCDQGIPTMEHRIAVYTVYTGQNAGSRDAENSVLWLKVYGASAIGVTGPGSTECFKPYWNPKKFENVLPVLWRSGDNAIYGIPRRSASLAHVIERSAIVTKPPENGLDVAPIAQLAAALDDPRLPLANMQWVNQHEAEIDADPGPNQLIYVQVTYDRGWQAIERNGRATIAADRLGMMVIDPGHSGPVRMRLTYTATAEDRVTRWAQILGTSLVVVWVITARKRKGRAPEPSLPERDKPDQPEPAVV